MVNIKEFFSELKGEIFKNILLNTFLRTVIAYFIFDIIISLFDFWYVFSYIFAGAYFTVRLLRQMRTIHVKVFEKHNPEVDVMISTAADNAHEDNIVVQELFRDVVEKARSLSSGSLIYPKVIMILIICMPVLAIIDFEMTPLRVDALSQDTLLEGINNINFVKGLLNRTKGTGEIIEDDLLEDDIYGDKKVANLGNKDVNIKMNMDFEIDLTRPKDEDPSQVNFKDYPDAGNVEIVYDASVLQENIEESDLARKYNEKVRNMR